MTLTAELSFKYRLAVAIRNDDDGRGAFLLFEFLLLESRFGLVEHDCGQEGLEHVVLGFHRINDEGAEGGESEKTF